MSFKSDEQLAKELQAQFDAENQAAVMPQPPFVMPGRPARIQGDPVITKVVGMASDHEVRRMAGTLWKQKNVVFKNFDSRLSAKQLYTKATRNIS